MVRVSRPLVLVAASAVIFGVVLGPALAGRGAQAQEKRTMWDGVYSDTQAKRGQDAYKTSCAPCHKADLLGDAGAPALAGPEFFSRWNGSSADDLVKTIRASMPQDAPDTLGTQTYVDLVTFLMKSNGSPAGTSELSIDSAALKQVMVSNPK